MLIHPTAVVDEGAQIGNGSMVWHFAHIRSGAVIGEGCTLGRDVYVDTGVTIGNRCKVQNGVSLYDGVTVADDVFIGPHAVFTNDKHPRAFGSWEKTPTRIEDHASIGAGAVIVCGVTIGSYAMVGAGAVVTHDVLPFHLVAGNPDRPIGFVCPCGMTAAVPGVCAHG